MCKDVKITTEQLTKAMDAEQQKLVQQVKDAVLPAFERKQRGSRTSLKLLIYPGTSGLNAPVKGQQIDYNPQGKL